MVELTAPFVDIHCHLLPGIDDGAKNLDESLAMARMAVDDGIRAIIVTPHQMGNNSHNTGPDICERTDQLQAAIDSAGIGLRILPGGDVRIDDGMIDQIISGEVLTLGNHRKHVLLELPHELYFPLEPLLAEMKQHGLVGILSHPERNEGILRNPELIGPLVEAGCLMQITANSLTGVFGPECETMSVQMLEQGWVHFLATDAHGTRRRSPKLRGAFDRAAELIGVEAANAICCHNPALVAQGKAVPDGVQSIVKPSARRSFFGWGKTA